MKMKPFETGFENHMTGNIMLYSHNADTYEIRCAIDENDLIDDQLINEFIKFTGNKYRCVRTEQINDRGVDMVVVHAMYCNFSICVLKSDHYRITHDDSLFETLGEILSPCCSSEIIYHDLCSECREHV